MAERFFRFSFQRFLKISWTDLLDGPAGRTSWTDQLDRSAGQTNWTDQLDGSAGWISWMDQLDGSARWISWMDQLDKSAGRTSSLYLKPWPVRIFEDSPFSLYIVAASESDEGLVFTKICLTKLFFIKKTFLDHYL